jgi:small subunit ribosomal protein S1
MSSEETLPSEGLAEESSPAEATTSESPTEPTPEGATQARPADEAPATEPTAPESAEPEVAPVAEESEEAPTEPVSEAPAGEAAPATAEGSAPVAEGATTEEMAAQPDASESAPKKVQLNPTGGDSLKAAGTIPGATPADNTVTDAEIGAAMSATTTPVNTGPVDIPDVSTVDLGGLDAEIEAAMAGDTKQAEAAAAAAEAAGTPQIDLPEEGARIEGIVQSVHGDDVFFDLGFRIPGIASLRQFEGGDPPETGKKHRVVVRKVDEAEGLITVNLPGGKQRLGGNWEAVEVGQIVDCTVNKTNKGGLEVNIGSMRAFLPAGQVDLAYVDNLEPFVGQKLQVKIIEANAKKRNLVVSRRAMLIEERKGLEKEFWESVEEGTEFTGRVKTIKDYGAFIDLGGADGFLHIGQIAWTHIKHPNEVLSEGQEITVKAVKIEKDKKKISLSMKELTQNPWVLAADKYPPESTVTGKVTRATDFGAFIELEPGIEGLAHISELDHKRVNKVTDVCRVGQEVTAKVLEFDGNRKRISLSLKALTVDPRIAEGEAADKAFQEAQAKRKPREDLRGGIGSPSAGGGLFGNPTDFK